MPQASTPTKPLNYNRMAGAYMSDLQVRASATTAVTLERLDPGMASGR
jgi:hypothetical protein